MEYQIPRTWVGSETVKRLGRLAFLGDVPTAEVLRRALAQYESSQSTYRTTIRDTALALFQACLADQQVVSDDLPAVELVNEPRDTAESELGELLGSAPAALGIREAITLFLAEMGIGAPPQVPTRE